MLVQEMLENAARRWPYKEALVCGDVRLSYSQIDEAANRLAHALRAHGVMRGDRVAILLENSAESVISIFGALKADAVFMVLHPGTKRDRLSLLLEDATPAALITTHSHWGELRDAMARTDSVQCVVWVGDRKEDAGRRVRSVGWDELESYPACPPERHSIDVDLATLIYTSGSTGQPKGVMSTHFNMVTATTSINGYLKNTADDVVIDVLPLAFDYGLYQVFLTFQAGAKLVLEKGFAFPAKTIALLEREQVTGLPGVPTLYALLLKYPNLLKTQLPNLRYATNTAAALPTSHIAQLREAWPNVRFFSMYGQTECKRISYLPPEQLEIRPSSVGVAIPNTEVYVLREDGERARPGEVGELVVRGSHVTRGYWRAPDLTEARFRPGPLPGERVLYTGDLFRMDDEGFLYFIARKDDIIKSRGEKVSPREIENAVCQLEGVAEAAVVGVPDAVLGQAIRLVVALHSGAELTEREVRAFCSQRLDDYMMPRYVEIMAELPRTENGKVDKALLVRDWKPEEGKPQANRHAARVLALPVLASGIDKLVATALNGLDKFDARDFFAELVAKTMDVDFQLIATSIVVSAPGL